MSFEPGTTLSDIIRHFEATQIAWVERRDGETGITASDPRVASRVQSLMGIVIANGNGSWRRFMNLIEEFEQDLGMTK